MTQGLKKRHSSFLSFFYLIVFYTASASKYFLQNQNILFLTEVILVRLEQLKSYKIRKKVNIRHVMMILGNPNFNTLKLL